MLKFLKQFVIFSCVAFTILSALGFAVDAGLKKSGIDNFPQWHEIEKGTINADLIVAGSSRAWVHISPYIIDSVLHLNSYNLGLDGHDFKIQNAQYEFYRKHNIRPRYIIHSLDIFMLGKKSELYQPEQFAPYLYDSIIEEGIKDYKGFSIVDYYNPFTKYQFRYQYITKGLLELFNIRHFESKKYKGYQGKDRSWNSSLEVAKKKNPNGWSIKLDKELIELFDSYLADCKKEGTEVFLVYTPEYVEGQRLINNRSEIMKLYQQLSQKHGIIFLDYSNDEISLHKSNFYNSQHMNREAAEIFSVKLGKDLKVHLAVEKNYSNN